MRSAHRFHSVGIDIGTTTSQLIFSALEIVNTAGPTSVPHYEFSKREIIHVSEVIPTPFDDQANVAIDRLDRFIRAEYERAGLSLAEVESGAVIITGETSKARNARDTVMWLAEGLGDFVVATAGPHLESVIAGKGSGAAEYSEKHAARVLNIDIGGGTSNYVVFEGGRVIDTACLNVGGHLVETDKSGRVARLHEPALAVLREMLVDRHGLADITAADLAAFADRMAQLVVEIIVNEPSALARKLLMTESLRNAYRLDALFISGGVGECLIRPTSESPFRFGDIGPLLAQALAHRLDQGGFPIREPSQTIRATVIGAGAHTLVLSGSTVWNKYKGPPLRNVPVVHPPLKWADFRPGALSHSWQGAVEDHDLEAALDLYALALPEHVPVTCQTVWQVALELQSFVRAFSSNSHPLVVVTAQDMGKALGMELFRLVRGRELLIVDEVRTRDGDYLDIGKGHAGQGALPITVKSLAFPH